MFNFLVVSSQLVFEGSADTQIFLIDKDYNKQQFLISFSGFLNSTSSSIETFRCSSVNIYTGASVKNIAQTTMKRSEVNNVTENHSYRRFDLSQSIKENILDWLFKTDEVINFN